VTAEHERHCKGPFSASRVQKKDWGGGEGKRKRGQVSSDRGRETADLARQQEGESLEKKERRGDLYREVT